MKEIKFRAWDNKEKCFINPANSYMNLTDGWVFNCKTDDGYEDLIVMQYTGLKDKNGVEIYEGDLCTDGDERSLIEIVWSANHNWGCLIIKGGVLSERLTFPLWQWDECRENRFRSLEVIGNIYENADLLK